MLVKGKTALIVGLANHNSIAWGITQSLLREGIERIAFSYQPRFEKSVLSLLDDVPNPLLVPADVTDDDSLDAAFETIDKEFGGLDVLVHSVAAARPEDLGGKFVDVSRDGFSFAQQISAHSLIELSRRAAPLMEKRGGGSIVCLSYLGGQRVVESYHVMGVAKASLEMSVRYLAADLGPQNIRVNALSPAPLNTLSARGVTGLRDMFNIMEERAPLRRNITIEEVGDSAVFFMSDLSRAVTGQVLFVDNGYSVLGI
jgi:enoyl-[acyl-carrier protein] reductase I